MHAIVKRAITQNEPPERIFAKLMDAIKYIESTEPEILSAEDYNAVLTYLPIPSNPYYVAYINEIEKNILNKIN